VESYLDMLLVGGTEEIYEQLHKAMELIK